MDTPPTDGLQEKIEDICDNKLVFNFTSAVLNDPANDYALDLRKILTRMNVANVYATMTYIDKRDEHIEDYDNRYSTRILTILKTIRHNSITEDMKNERIQSTGQITTAHSMCLFVCGLLTHPTMSFNALVSSHPAYADAFFDAMIAQSSTKITVAVVDAPASAASLTAIAGEQTQVSAACFICAKEDSPENITKNNTLVLDAFSDKDQYLKYPPVVWHLHCLWLFNTDNNMRCYAARTPTVSYIFIGNYAEHVQRVKANVTDRTQAVTELLVKPLEMYRESITKSTIPNTTPTISRILHDDFQFYMPLVYAQLLLKQDIPLYADTSFNTTLESILAFVVGKTHKDIIDTLPYTPANTDPFTITNNPTADRAAYGLLAKAHYDLMMANTFVIPEDATNQHILFEAFDTASASPHLDHIAAVCRVRYNWVFDIHSGHQNISLIPELQPDAPYHEIDVHRHIKHVFGAPLTLAQTMFKHFRIGSIIRL